jgi:hypothetical protein
VPQHGEGGREAVTTWRKRGGREGGRRRLKMDAAAAWGMSGGGRGSVECGPRVRGARFIRSRFFIGLAERPA